MVELTAPTIVVIPPLRPCRPLIYFYEKGLVLYVHQLLSSFHVLRREDIPTSERLQAFNMCPAKPIIVVLLDYQTWRDNCDGGVWRLLWCYY